MWWKAKKTGGGIGVKFLVTTLCAFALGIQLYLDQHLSLAGFFDTIEVSAAQGSAGQRSAYPSYEVTLTNYGWTTPQDLNFSRRMVTSEFYNGILSHPQYSPLAFAQVNESPFESNNSNRTLIIFLDVDTCAENLYPTYGIGRKWWLNADHANGRTSGGGFMKPVENGCQYLVQASKSAALLANPRNRLVVLDCMGFSKELLANSCRRRPNASEFVKALASPQVMIASYSQTNRGTRKGIDVGIPPPAIKPINLSKEERAQVQNCEPRKYLFAFQGRKGFGRERMLAMENETDAYIRVISQGIYMNDLKSNSSVDTHDYKSLMTSAVFGGVPRGDALFSYRFAETLSAGTVPVVYANDWLVPFHPSVVNWTDCAVFIAEEEMAQTTKILRAIPPQKVCEMRRCALRVWDTYVSSRAGWVRGLVESALATSGQLMESDVV